MANANNQFIGQSPRYVIEAVGMVLIAIAVWLISQPYDNTMVVSILGTLALELTHANALQQVFSSGPLLRVAANPSKMF